MKRVVVFGGSRPRPGDSAYENALRLGQYLGEAGYTVLTGGYIGTMEAVSRGAAEAGGHVIGVTCEEIEKWRPGKPNAWVQEEYRFPTLRQHLFVLVEENDAAIALPGGPGTLAEISVLWNHLLINALAPRPLILVGDEWRTVMEQFFTTMAAYIPPEQQRWLHFAPDVEAGFQLLQSLLILN